MSQTLEPRNKNNSFIVTCERSRGYTPDGGPVADTFPTIVPKARWILVSSHRKRFSWLAREEYLAPQGYKLTDWFPPEQIMGGLHERFHMYDFVRFAGNAYHLPSILCFKESVRPTQRCSVIGRHVK